METPSAAAASSTSFVYQMQSRASDSSDGKSACASLTYSLPALSHRPRHSALAGAVLAATVVFGLGLG